MEIRRLRYFVRVAEDGSLTRAAGQLRIAQPALSRQMRLLEDELGVALFVRTARGMRLTAAGEQLRAAVAGPLRDLELALHNARTGQDDVQTSLVIGMPPGLSDLLAYQMTIGLRADFPFVHFKLVEGPTGSLSDWLNRGMIDLALLEESAWSQQLTEHRIAQLPLAVAMAPHHSERLTQPVPLADLADLPLIVPSHHLGIRAAIDDMVAQSQTALHPIMEADSPRLAKQLAQSGIGFAILPRAYFAAETADGRLACADIADPAPSITIYLASRKGSQAASSTAGEVERALAALATAGLRG